MSETIADSIYRMERIFCRQKEEFNASPYPDRKTRIESLQKLKKSLLENQKNLTQAISEDYGHRAEYDTLIADILPVISHIRYTKRKLKAWMKPDKRSAGLLLAPARLRVEYQPKGVCGIISPWNFPVVLSLTPLVTAIAAGNRAMLKLSEFTPRTNEVIRELLASCFEEAEVAVVEGKEEISARFTELPFDHLLFTGSASIGREVIKSSSKHLTPLTLELGGKSPVIIADDFPVELAAERVIYGKCLNAGQICVAPDYVFCPEDKLVEFILAYCNKFRAMYPDFDNDADYSEIINEKQAKRLHSLLVDAVYQGAKIYSADSISPAESDIHVHPDNKKWPTQIIVDVTENMALMKEEIFGPILPVIPYTHLEDPINYIKGNARPLALYLMSNNSEVRKAVLSQTHSGGVCINETLVHVAANDAPFGGIGPSGMGHYHGVEGFRTFSHAKTVLQKGRFDTGKLLHPPYGRVLQKLILWLFMK
ncbi:coniferyl aldehyde dehydrogenase [Vibrio sp. JC009]|uniref:coniferyl aldehyde dehydrogenase n=1 Tax=Vibrio sp. JC009 TaxID=2912314 RepID=UPI0023B167DB|nr:coniferyl aldehyde dehydrogenase [Vibrio sp. JC009]WED24274.1 coniferyl aldehyde dehydrogenase [Vibrio sp. JC009]